MIKKILKIFKIIKPLIITLLGIYFTNKFNALNYISFIPKDKTFGFCTGIYITFLDNATKYLLEKIHSKFMSEITVILSLKNTKPSIDSTPIINFNDLGIAKANITIKIIGRKKHFKNCKLKIPSINFATIQNSGKDKEIHIDCNGNCIVNLDEMFNGTNQITDLSASFEINFIKEPIDSKKSTGICPELEGKTLFIIYNHNSAKLENSAILKE